MLDKLVDDGKLVIATAHLQAVMAHADCVVDLGPGAGQDGGRMVFEGRPSELVAMRSTLNRELIRQGDGRRIAILLDGVVMSAPVVRGVIDGGNVSITIGRSEGALEEAKKLAAALAP